MEGEVIYIRNKLIPNAEQIEYRLLFRYADRVRKTIPINLEVYINEERKEFIFSGIIMDYAFNEWTLIRFLDEKEFTEFVNSLYSTKEDINKYFVLANLSIDIEEALEERFPYRIRIISLTDDYEISRNR